MTASDQGLTANGRVRLVDQALSLEPSADP